MLDAEPDRWDLSRLRSMIVGGAAAPQAMIEGFERRHGLHIIARLGHDRDGADGHDLRRSRAGSSPSPRTSSTPTAPSRASPLRSSRSAPAAAKGIVPWDGATMGELEVRGPWIASSYYNAPEADDRWTDDGWFKTGDIVTIEPNGYVEIQDRSKDLVKSGGEWISTVALENALMGHPAVLEAAVIAVPDEKWSERPLAVVVFREGQTADADELRDVPRAALRQVVAAGAVRGRRRDPEDGRRQVPQDRAARAVRRSVGARRGLARRRPSTEEDHWERSSPPSTRAPSRSSRSTTRR